MNINKAVNKTSIYYIKYLDFAYALFFQHFLDCRFH